MPARKEDRRSALPHGSDVVRDVLNLGLMLAVSLILADLVVEVGGLGDFVEYWSAVQLNASGGNPYDPAQLWPLQLGVRPAQQVVIMMWNPPWTLGLLSFLRPMDYASAELIWASINLSLLTVCASWLWLYFGGGRLGALAAGLLALCFPAVLIATSMGQISPWILLGLCGFLYFESRNQSFRAGVCASLMLLKPHYLLLFWFVLVLESIRKRNASALVGSFSATALMLCLAMAFNPAVWSKYLAALAAYPPDYMVGPTLGTLARVLFGWERLWLQFVPTLLGVAGLTVYWWRNRHTWAWNEQVALVVVISALTAPYGWLFDQVVLLIPAIQLLRWLGRYRTKAFSAAVAISFVGVLLTLKSWPFGLLEHHAGPGSSDALMRAVTQPNSLWQVVVAPVFAVGYLMAARHWRAHITDTSSSRSR